MGIHILFFGEIQIQRGDGGKELAKPTLYYTSRHSADRKRGQQKKTSKSVKIFDTFRHFAHRAKNRQKVSKIFLDANFPVPSNTLKTKPQRTGFVQNRGFGVQTPCFVA